jgi:hypothetical protein
MKAQSIPEFMVVYAAIIAIFMVVFAVAFGGSINLYQSQDSVSALCNAYDVATALNYVYLAGDGASYNFTMSGLGNGENITIWGSEVESQRTTASATVPLLDGNVNATLLNETTLNGSIIMNETTLGGNNVSITNSGGELYIN